MPSRRYVHIRRSTEQLCIQLKPEDYVVQPALFASPPKWHLGHTTWFFESFVLAKALKDYQPYNEKFHYLFNSYYESLGSRLPRDKRGFLFRPALEEIFDYRQHVDEHMIRLLHNKPEEDMMTLIELGLQHEQQHQELFVTDTKYLFSCNPLLPVWDEVQTVDDLRKETEYDWIQLDTGYFQVGYDGKDFSFDNEREVHTQFIPAFRIMDRPVINSEYLEFIEDGGYEDFRLWLMEGWEWLNAGNIRMPMHWHKKDDQWFFYHIDGLKPLAEDAPAMHLSYYEADAFARWKGYRLPSEFEWEIAAKYNAHAFTPAVWEWTSSAYLPYPGFKAREDPAGEYNGKFMINQMVLRGGSFATPEGHLRPTYRNFFHPHEQWQFSGLRLAESISKKKQ